MLKLLHKGKMYRNTKIYRPKKIGIRCKNVRSVEYHCLWRSNSKNSENGKSNCLAKFRFKKIYDEKEWIVMRFGKHNHDEVNSMNVYMREVDVVRTLGCLKTNSKKHVKRYVRVCVISRREIMVAVVFKLYP